MAKKRRSKRTSKKKQGTRVHARKNTNTINLRSSQYKPYIAPTVQLVGLEPKGRKKRSQRPKNNQKTTNNKKPLTLSPKLETVTKQDICKRRSERKQIIHALKRSGKSGQKKPDNKFNNIKC